MPQLPINSIFIPTEEITVLTEPKKKKNEFCVESNSRASNARSETAVLEPDVEYPIQRERGTGSDLGDWRSSQSPENSVPPMPVQEDPHTARKRLEIRKLRLAECDRDKTKSPSPENLGAAPWEPSP